MTIQHSPHERHLVLVVGDVSDDTTLTAILLDAGFDAIAVQTGHAALQLLESGVEPCVVVIDTDCPDMDSRDLWRRVHEVAARRGPAGILVTATESQAIPAGMVPIGALMRKPAARDRLIEIIERHCPRRDSAAVA
jgi:CheY-like chemotaxis protein